MLALAACAADGLSALSPRWGVNRRASFGALQRAGDDRELLAAVAEGADREAFDELCRRFTPRLQAFLRNRSRAEPEELVQEVMLTVWRKATLYNPAKAAPSTWIFTIARNKAIDLARRRRAAPDPGDPHWVERAGPSPTPAPDEHAAAVQMQARLLAGLDELPVEQAAVIRRVYLEALTLREAARELEIPLGTAKSRVRLALAALRKSFLSKEIDRG